MYTYTTKRNKHIYIKHTYLLTTPSNCLNVNLVFFFSNSIDLTATIEQPARFVKRNLTCALTCCVPTLRGSCTNDCPEFLPGGNAPHTANLRDSIIVVLPGVVVMTIFF